MKTTICNSHYKGSWNANYWWLYTRREKKTEHCVTLGMLIPSHISLAVPFGSTNCSVDTIYHLLPSSIHVKDGPLCLVVISKSIITGTRMKLSSAFFSFNSFSALAKPSHYLPQFGIWIKVSWEPEERDAVLLNDVVTLGKSKTTP